LGWQPEYTFAAMIREMVEADMEAVTRETGTTDTARSL